MSGTERPPTAERQQQPNEASVDGRTVRAARHSCRPVIGMEDAIKRFKEARPFHVDGPKFNADTFKRKADEHRRTYNMQDIQPMGQTYSGIFNKAQEEKTVTLNTVPLFGVGDYSFFVDPDEPLKEGFSVFTDDAREIARSRGFVEVKYSHLTSNQAIPQRDKAKSVVASADKPAPTHLKLPDKIIPNLFKKNEETWAQAVVRAFEDKFVDTAGHTIYSPCKLWNTKACKEAGLKGNQTSKLSAWCCAYYAIRVEKKGVAPAETKETIKELRSLASANKPTNMPPGGWIALAQQL